jgi:DNA modification methylase
VKLEWAFQFFGSPLMKLAYRTKNGAFYNSSIEEFLESKTAQKYKGKVNLVFTSPPFPLLRKKRYGNYQDEEYVMWLSDLSIKLKSLLSRSGSIVMEIGNTWEKGQPVMSTLALEALLQFLKKGELQLCQQFVWYNPAKLPSPAQWVNVKRVRVKDSFTHIWWMSKVSNPKANNRMILKEYSKSMKALLKSGKYNSGIRPSEHNIGVKSFAKNNNGAIPSNVITASNTHANTPYQAYCKRKGITAHPARMPLDLPLFFIKFLTSKGDLVFDPFCGSNTTGEAAESLNRRWLGVELSKDYIKGSVGRFPKKRIKVRLR